MKNDKSLSTFLRDLWRNFYKSQRQYKRAHFGDDALSLARLGCFYGFRHNYQFLQTVLFLQLVFLIIAWATAPPLNTM